MDENVKTVSCHHCRNPTRFMQFSHGSALYQCIINQSHVTKVSLTPPTPTPAPLPKAATGHGYMDQLESNRVRSRAGPTKCDCCGGSIRVYRRKLNSGMAATLCWMTSRHSPRYLHLPTEAPRWALRNGNHTKLPHWGLAEAMPNDDPAKKNSGFYRTTEKGRAFARGEVTVPTHVFLRSPGDVLLGFEDTSIDIRKALGNTFNYAELMRGP